MTHVHTILQETDLVGTLTAPLSTTGTSATAIFIDKKTGAAATPQSTTLYFTINKGNSRSETIQCDSHTTASGVTTLTINGTTGRAVPKYGTGTGTTTGGSHDAGDEIGCVDVAYPHNVHANILNGTNATGGTSLSVGSEAAADQSLYFANDHATKPRIYWDDSEKRHKVTRGDDEGATGETELSGAVRLTTTERNALTTPLDGMQIYNVTDGKFQDRIASAWVDRESGGTFANASTIVAGKKEDATQSQNDAGTATGETGATLCATPDVNAVTIQKQSWVYAADAEANDTYVITIAPAIAAYATGQKFSFKANTANTGACTLNVNSKGAKAIKKAYNLDVVTGDILAGQICDVTYDGTNFQLLNPSHIDNTLSAIGATVTAANLDAITNKSTTILHEHTKSLTETRQCFFPTDGTGGACTGNVIAATLSDGVSSETANHHAPFLRPTGYNIDSVKLYIFLATAVTGNLYGVFSSSSYAAGATGAVTTDTLAHAAYAVVTGTNNFVTQVTVPTTAYTNWSAGDYCYFNFSREGADALDTLGQSVFAIKYEVTYTLA